MPNTVDVDAAEARLALHAFEARIPGMARNVGTDFAGKVAGRARRGIPLGPSAGGHARSSIHSIGETVTAGAGFPYYPWLDFGGRVGIRNSVFRPFLRRGRYVFRSYHELKFGFEGQMDRAMIVTAESSGLDAS